MEHLQINLQIGKSILHQFEVLHNHWDTPIVRYHQHAGNLSVVGPHDYELHPQL